LIDSFDSLTIASIAAMKKASTKKQKLKVVELFAGVGGFHLGFQRAGGYEIAWANQWEPSTKRQHAYEVYAERFPETPSSNDDIAKVPTEDIPDHDILVGGFPCQDYSVARTLSHAEGIVGKKGVLWWQIERILREKGSKAPKFLMLENVDRLLKSPVNQRGRDFAVMLASLANLGYAVEWRVINAADYGMPQRRRRVYILGYKKGTKPYKEMLSLKKEIELWMKKAGLMAKAFPIDSLEQTANFSLTENLGEVSTDFNKDGSMKIPFGDAGIMLNHKVSSWKTAPKFSGQPTPLKNIVQPDTEVADEYFIKTQDLKKWQYLKGAKKELRGKKGYEYHYTEGPVAFPDSLDKPARTIVTGEGGPGASRFKHVIKTRSGRYRRLTPLELERANMFPDNHTAGTSDTKRAFFMGNALVVGVIEQLARHLKKH
jgi:DNA (cytosine-5)-methyltransferase 1